PRFVQEQSIRRPPAARTLRAGQETQRLPRLQLQVLAVQRRADLLDPLAQVVVVLEVRHDPVETNPRRLLVVRRVQDQLFAEQQQDRKSTRLNSSHVKISYAVFCLKKKIP